MQTIVSFDEGCLRVNEAALDGANLLVLLSAIRTRLEQINLDPSTLTPEEVLALPVGYFNRLVSAGDLVSTSEACHLLDNPRKPGEPVSKQSVDDARISGLAPLKHVLIVGKPFYTKAWINERNEKKRGGRVRAGR